MFIVNYYFVNILDLLCKYILIFYLSRNSEGIFKNKRFLSISYDLSKNVKEKIIG